ncbi:MAG: hypothetical protein LKK13_04360 [Bacilli bacterium]|jgi:radical SAM protein with 4Fe4S-binding SPASM domain|nr:hypothetical protein [Bacilli bacterium]
MSSVEAISDLDFLFSSFPRGEKYFVDMSGKGEPLMNLKTILSVADYCKKQSNRMRVEIIPSFVCNGTLLTPEIAEVLQTNGVLFGVSLDGEKAVHDRHRLSKNGSPTFDQIVKNVAGIANRNYVGCAVTIGADTFDLCKVLSKLLLLFKTISIRPVRGGAYCLTPVSEKKWEHEYDKLSLRLLFDSEKDITKAFFALMNGDDLFGRYLNRMFCNQRTINRCDAGISRFTFDIGGGAYPCPSCSFDNTWRVAKNRLVRESNVALTHQAHICQDCYFKRICGGSCQLVTDRTEQEALCSLNKHLILLAAYLWCKISETKILFYERLVSFSKVKMARYRADAELSKYLASNPAMSFVDGKRLFDEVSKRY